MTYSKLSVKEQQHNSANNGDSDGKNALEPAKGGEVEGKHLGRTREPHSTETECLNGAECPACSAVQHMPFELLRRDWQDEKCSACGTRYQVRGQQDCWGGIEGITIVTRIPPWFILEIAEKLTKAQQRSITRDGPFHIHSWNFQGHQALIRKHLITHTHGNTGKLTSLGFDVLDCLNFTQPKEPLHDK